MERTADIATLLSRVDLFSELSRNELARLASVAIPRHYEAGTRVFREGDRGDVCHVMRSGRARVVRQHHAGREITLANLGPGDVFGELAMLDGEIRSATVEAITNVETLAFVANDMRRLLAAAPEVSVKLLKAVVRRLKQANERISTQSFQTVSGRVAKSLLQLGRESALPSRTTAKRTSATIYATQAEIAQLAGTSRESVSRFISTLKRAGVVKCGRARITIEDPEALTSYIY